jgi:hypothetical protein
VEPVSQTPTEASDYAVLSITYGSMLSALAYASRSREPIEQRELVTLAAATFALAKLVGKEKVETWVRQPFVDERPRRPAPKGRRLRYAVGELLTCTRCLGAWSALSLVALRLASPDAGRTVTSVLAASAGNDFMQSGFTWMCARTDREQRGSTISPPAMR